MAKQRDGITINLGPVDRRFGAFDLDPAAALAVSNAEGSPFEQSALIFGSEYKTVYDFRAMLAEAGVPSDLEGVSEARVIELVTAYVGASPSARDPADKLAMAAWALVAFAAYDYWRRLAREAENIDKAVIYSTAIGRLIELWRYRRLGVEAKARHGSKFRARDTYPATEARIVTANARNSEVVAQLQKLINAKPGGFCFANGRVNASRLANAYLNIHGDKISEKTLRIIIKKAVENGVLAITPPFLPK